MAGPGGDGRAFSAHAIGTRPNTWIRAFCGTYPLVGMHPDPGTGSAAGVARLLERDKEFLAIDDAIRAALAGDGTAVVLEGPAGIGKTSLLDAARRRAVEAGMTVIASHGAFL